MLFDFSSNNFIFQKLLGDLLMKEGLSHASGIGVGLSRLGLTPGALTGHLEKSLNFHVTMQKQSRCCFQQLCLTRVLCSRVSLVPEDVSYLEAKEGYKSLPVFINCN